MVCGAGPPGPIPSTHVVLRRGDLAAAAAAGVSALVDLLKQSAAGAQLSGPLRIVAIKAAGVLAVQRPALIGRVLPCLLALADSGRSAAVCVPVTTKRRNTHTAPCMHSVGPALAQETRPQCRPRSEAVEAAAESKHDRHADTLPTTRHTVPAFDGMFGIHPMAADRACT